VKFALTIAYDGSNFDGWQSQRTGNAVQDVLEKVLSELAGERVRIHGAGRTDRGVHALGQVAHFSAQAGCRGSAEIWKAACNASLPPAIRVVEARVVPEKFHARFDATAKHYRYLVCDAPVLSPFLVGRVWHRKSMDLGKLAAALELFQGTHDFASFTPRPSGGKRGSVRTLHAVRLTRIAPHLLAIDLLGDGFLYKMARLIVGEALRCAAGKETVEQLATLLHEPKTGFLHHIAPPDGLYLVRVFYEDTIELPTTTGTSIFPWSGLTSQ